MRVLMNGQPVDELSAKDEKRLSLCAEREVAEGKVMSVDEAVAATGRRLKLVVGVTCGIGAAIFAGALIGAAAYEPRDLVYLIPVALILAGALAALIAFIYRRKLAGTRVSITPRLARMAPAGAPIRVDASGVSLAGRQAAWSEIGIGSVEFRRVPVSEGPDMTIIESLILSHQGRSIVLDSGGMTNGRAIVDKTWRRLRTR